MTIYAARVLCWIGMAAAFYSLLTSIIDSDYLWALFSMLLGAANNKMLIDHKRQFGD